eukprot:3180073-Prymnesium_polylepis.1
MVCTPSQVGSGARWTNGMARWDSIQCKHVLYRGNCGRAPHLLWALAVRAGDRRASTAPTAGQ